VNDTYRKHLFTVTGTDEPTADSIGALARLLLSLVDDEEKPPITEAAGDAAAERETTNEFYTERTDP